MKSKAMTFQNWDITKWLTGSKRAIITILGILLTAGADWSPDVKAVITITGLTADRLFALIYYFMVEKK